MSRSARTSIFVAVAASGIAAMVSREARADLAAEADQLVRDAKAEGALVEHPSPKYLWAGDAAIFAPLDAVSGADACATFVVLTDRSTQFTVSRGPREIATADLLVASDKDPTAIEASDEGVYVHAACGADLTTMARAIVRMRSERGSVEVVIARSNAPLGAIDKLLASRSRGASASDGVAMNHVGTGPIDDRKKASAVRARARGATGFVSVSMRGSSQGLGEFDLHVGKGCHALDVLGESNDRVDIDATLKTHDGTALGEDDTEAPDAHLEACFPEPEDVVLQFTGAASQSLVHVMDAVFAWPKWINERWGVRAATALATLAFGAPGFPRPTDPPVAEAIGGPGTTLLHEDVEPNRCYLATVGATRGTARGFRLSATASATTVVGQAGPNVDAVDVVFCAQDQARASFMVEAPSPNVSWVLSLYPLGAEAQEP